MAARSFWRAKTKLLLAATAVGGAGAGAVAIANSEDPASALKLSTAVPIRLLRDAATAATIAFGTSNSYSFPIRCFDRPVELNYLSAWKNQKNDMYICILNSMNFNVKGKGKLDTCIALVLVLAPASRIGRYDQRRDYEYSLWGLPEGSIERDRAKHEVHTRSAIRLQELCFRNEFKSSNAGLNEIALFQEYLVPNEYVQIMRQSMLNRCPVSSYDQVLEVFKKELGGVPDEIFDEFDPVPIASASLAQVHIARTHDGEQVAVKVQHTHMTDTAAADYATVELIVNTLHRLFPSFDYRWLVDEVRDSLPKELDFLIEAKNSIKCMDNFRKFSPHIAEYVYAPKIYWNLSTSKLLVMEFIDGAQVNDCRAIQKLGIQPTDVSKLLSQAFAEMMFKHGFVHCDPHAANVLVRPLPSGSRSIFGEALFRSFSMETFRYCFGEDFCGKKKPQLVLLDHGLYKDLEFNMRINYASLWKGLVFSDANAIKENSVKLGAGEDLYVLFAGILTMRPWNKVIDPAIDHLVVQGTDSDRSELQFLIDGILLFFFFSVCIFVLQMYASQYFPQITELLRRLPRVILLMLKTNDCLRAVNRALMEGSSLETFLIVGRVSSEAVIESRLLRSRSILSRVHVWFEEFLLEARLLGMQIALWFLKFHKALTL
ncbi:hypothetical protein DH2020_022313 [Rehmannia glutinosa]|uniref:ABC1 atypical kinase-like domain-containing protein n=1 Tax=Rehmannia glutinosa TaxID=99300 RepID=A0ABR0WCZ5_REHGL